MISPKNWLTNYTQCGAGNLLHSTKTQNNKFIDQTVICPKLNIANYAQLKSIIQDEINIVNDELKTLESSFVLRGEIFEGSRDFSDASKSISKYL